MSIEDQFGGHDLPFLSSSIQNSKCPGTSLTDDILATCAGLNPSLAAHQLRVGHLAQSIARVMGLSEEDAEIALEGGKVHDVGKLYDQIASLIRLPRRLRPTERAMVELHPVLGEAILEQLKVQHEVARVAGLHHECLDGSGINGLKGTKIPPAVRAVSMADMFDAMTCVDRPYRKPEGLVTVLGLLANERFSTNAHHALLGLIAAKGFSPGSVEVVRAEQLVDVPGLPAIAKGRDKIHGPKNEIEHLRRTVFETACALGLEN